MLDFLVISTKHPKQGIVEIFPKFRTEKHSDIMIRGGDFYAIWVESRGLWSTDECDAIKLIDMELDDYAESHKEEFSSYSVRIQYMWDSDSGSIDRFHKYCQKQMRDNYHSLDEAIIFANSPVKKRDYASKRLEYSLEEGDISAWDKLMSVLYSEEERIKIEWAIGSIVTGASKKLQKFMVLYGAAGTGKSTVLNIIQELFDGYYSVFDAKALGSSNNSFALEAFKNNPLVAIQHDGDLSRIEDNTRLNSLVSHEYMTVNEKFKSTYSNRFKCFLFMGTNKPVKITDARSGLIRRLIDVHPSGNKIPVREYRSLIKQIEFELGAIAYYCKEVYLENEDLFDDYTPNLMMEASNDFYNFVVDSYSIFLKEDGVSAKVAWPMYKEYCNNANVPYPMSFRIFKEELKNYFWNYEERHTDNDGKRIRSYYSGFRTDIFEEPEEKKKKRTKRKEENQDAWLIFKDQESLFDISCKDYQAQYAKTDGTPEKAWSRVKTTLSELETRELHYVRVPENHIVIDFDLKDADGNKSYDKNFQAALNWKPTYAELSKSGAGIHLHYIYKGDPNKLLRLYDEAIEVKVFSGKSALRRKLTKCNNLPIADISGGLPVKEEKMVDSNTIKNEKHLRTMIKKNLNKEVHSSTRCSIDFIYKLLDDAYSSGLHYDVSDMRNAVTYFAANSTNQAEYCMKLASKMKFKSEETSKSKDGDDEPLVFYDVEVFPNLFLVNWKYAGEGKSIVRMINPKPKDIEELLNFKLVGFNNRRYDNHMLYGCLLGYSNEQLYNLSQSIINVKKGEKSKGFFGEAYNLSYTDIYDFAATKQSLKKWEIELGIHHQELGLPWDQPVPEELWPTVAEYCDNDVIATEAVFNHLQGDFTARKILAALANGSVNDTTNSLTTRIIFGIERHPNLIYTDLATGERSDGTVDPISFPGYEYISCGEDKHPHNMYCGEDVGFGGYVYANPGMYGRTKCYDIAGMHPCSAIALGIMGTDTDNFKDIVAARVAIKHKEFDKAKKMLGGKLAPYLNDESQAKELAKALKIAVNSVYGLTSAKFDNPFRDPRNVNNIVALRGALFMVNLKHEVQKRGFKVIHIKTDSIKVVDPTDELDQFIFEYGLKYGYNFEIEHVFERICLVNDAVYIAKLDKDDPDDPGKWTATGKQFAVPYVFKTLFSKEPVNVSDMCETFSVKSALYLDMNETFPDVSKEEKELSKLEDKYKKGTLSDISFEPEAKRLVDIIKTGHDYQFVGKVGQFCPIKPGFGGGLLMREQNGKYYAATGTTGYRWLESESTIGGGIISDGTSIVDNPIDIVDTSYYNDLANKAIDAINGVNKDGIEGNTGYFDYFVSDLPYENSSELPDFMKIPDGAAEELPFN